MELLLDNQNFEIEEPCKDLGTVIKQMERRLFESRRVIVRICLDDRELTPEDEESLADYSLDKINTLTVLSEQPKNLVLQGLKDGVDEVLPDLLDNLKSLADDLRAQDLARANEQIKTLSDHLIWLTTICHNLSRTHPQFVESSEGRELVKKLTHLGPITGEIIGFQENEDWVSLADIIEFELTELVEYFKEIFTELLQREETPNA